MTAVRAEQAPPSFRSATAADVPQIVALVESAYRGDVSRAGWTTEADLLDGQRTDPEDVSGIVTDPDGRVVMVERDGTTLACFQLEHRGDHAYFGMFAVRPDLQGGGVGRAALAEAERIARDEWGAADLRMTVIVQREELIAWYERRGYRRTGERKPFPYGNERFGRPRRDDLEFEVLTKAL